MSFIDNMHLENTILHSFLSSFHFPVDLILNTFTQNIRGAKQNFQTVSAIKHTFRRNPLFRGLRRGFKSHAEFRNGSLPVKSIICNPEGRTVKALSAGRTTFSRLIGRCQSGHSAQKTRTVPATRLKL